MNDNYLDFGLIKNAYGKTAEYRKNNAVAKAIELLLLGVPGFIASKPQMGINIKQYIHEKATDENLKIIEREIKQQISQYITDSEVTVKGKYLNKDSKYHELLRLGIIITITSQEEEDMFAFLIKKNANSPEITIDYKQILKDIISEEKN